MTFRPGRATWMYGAATHRRVGGSLRRQCCSPASRGGYGRSAAASRVLSRDSGLLPISQQMSTGKNGDPSLRITGRPAVRHRDILAATLQHAPTSAQRRAAWSRYKASTAQVRARNQLADEGRESRSGTHGESGPPSVRTGATVTAGTLPGGPLWTAWETAGA